MINYLRVFFLVAAAVPALATAAERELAPLPVPMTSFGAASSDGYVYVYGGHSGKTHTYSTESTIGQFIRLNIAKPAKWEELTGGPILQGLGLVAHDGKIYRIGGMQPKNKATEKMDAFSVASIARYDPKTQKWENLPDMPEGRSSHDAVVLGDKIYVVGGWKMNGVAKESEWLKTAVALDLTKAPLVWETIPQPFERRAIAASAYRGKVYVIGGLTPDGDTVKTVEVYDPATKKWSKAADLPGGSMNGFTPGACVAGGRLLVNPADGKLYRLSTDEKAWEEVGVVKRPRYVHRIVPAGASRIIVLGGASKQGPVGLVEEIEPAREPITSKPKK
jgi:N-acetylneuraminic acid mutarotase